MSAESIFISPHMLHGIMKNYNVYVTEYIIMHEAVQGEFRKSGEMGAWYRIRL
jgi:hypothetical protein